MTTFKFWKRQGCEVSFIAWETKDTFGCRIWPSGIGM